MIKLVVFDCDGTLVDSQFMINACMTDAFDHVGLQAPPLSAVRRVVGLPLARAIEVLACNDRAPIDDMVKAYSGSWQKLRNSGGIHEPLYEGTDKLLEQLKSSQWTLGVATGKSMRGLRQTLDHHNLGGYFSTLQTADHARGKPDPEMLHLAMAETGAVPSDTYMIGDTTYDVDMAVAAGVRAIGVNWGYHAPEDLTKAGALHIAESVAGLMNFFKEMEGKPHE
jgi:phosphoglycolate phosphatase